MFSKKSLSATTDTFRFGDKKELQMKRVPTAPYMRRGFFGPCAACVLLRGTVLRWLPPYVYDPAVGEGFAA
jgi:hypothetical protein